MSSVLNIPQSEYDHIMIIDPHVKKETLEDKYGILDVKLMTKSGYALHIEIQVAGIPEMIQRTVFYQSKMVTEQIWFGTELGHDSENYFDYYYGFSARTAK